MSSATPLPPRCPAPTCGPNCAVCLGSGTVLPLRAASYHRCHRIVAHLRATQCWTNEMRLILGLSRTQWDEMEAGALPEVYVNRTEQVLGLAP